jgi:hypothetical protein
MPARLNAYPNIINPASRSDGVKLAFVGYAFQIGFIF